MSYEDLLGMAKDEILDPVIVEKGEYTLRIKHADIKSAKSGRAMYVLSLDILDADQENPATVFHNVLKIHESDDADKRQMFGQMFNNFVECFGVDTDVAPDEFCESLVGLEGTCLLNVEHSEEYGDKNNIKRFIPAS